MGLEDLWKSNHCSCQCKVRAEAATEMGLQHQEQLCCESKSKPLEELNQEVVVSAQLVVDFFTHLLDNIRFQQEQLPKQIRHLTTVVTIDTMAIHGKSLRPSVSSSPICWCIRLVQGAPSCAPMASWTSDELRAQQTNLTNVFDNLCTCLWCCNKKCPSLEKLCYVSWAQENKHFRQEVFAQLSKKNCIKVLHTSLSDKTWQDPHVQTRFQAWDSVS